MWLSSIRVSCTLLARKALLTKNIRDTRPPKLKSFKGYPPVTIYHYDLQGQLIAETNVAGNAQREYVYHGMNPVAQIDTKDGVEAIHYLHTDHLYTPRFATSQAQQIAWRWEGDGFGSAEAEEINLVVNLRFPGQYYDSETGLHYNYFRYYDPSLGRYIQSDPIGLAGGINTYGYALQNPLRYTDPFGLATWGCVRLNIGASLLVWGIGKIIYTCDSECVNGKKIKARFEVGYIGPNIGAKVDYTGSYGNKFVDGNETPNPDVFNGNYFEASAGASGGIGYGIGAAGINGGSSRGGVTGSLTGVQAGVGLGAGEFTGTARLIWQKEINCGDECE